MTAWITEPWPKRLGILGMTFEPCQPKTVYHKVILAPQPSGEAMPEGWTYLLRSSVRTIITREQPLSEAENELRIGKMTMHIAGKRMWGSVGCC